MRGLLTPRRRLAVACALVASTGALAAGCGGDDGGGGNDADATALLQKSFSKSIPSARVKLSAQLDVDGLRGFDKPITLDASGPYESATKTIPKLDLDISIGAAGQGQSLETGFLSTGNRAFLKFGGAYYEQSKASVRNANRQLGNDGAKKGPLGLEPAKWVREAKQEGEQTIGGVPSDHVSAQLDVRALLEQLNALARRSATAVGGATTPDPLTTQQLDQAESAVQDPRFDVYVGKRDGFVHRMSGNVSLKVPEDAQKRVNGIRGASLRFTVDITDTGGKQDIEAPSSSRPISELSSQLGGAAALNGLGGGQGTDTTPTTPGTTTGPEADRFQRYSQCLDRTKPSDARARNRCRSLLEP